MSKRLQREHRFRAIDERDREEVFQDFIERLGDQERENKRLQSLNRIEQLKEEFKHDESINLETRWKTLEDMVESKRHSKALYAELSPMDILTAFEDYIKDLEKDD